MQKDFYELIVNGSGNGILVFDRECRYILWNPAMERISGIGREEALGRSAFDLFPSLKESGEDRYLLEALAGKSNVVRGRKPYSIAPDSDDIFFERTYSPLRDDSGEIIGGVVVVREITERVRAEVRLRESEKLYRDLVENSLGLISAHDLDGLLLSVNPAAARLLGYRPEEMVGRYFGDFIAPSMRNLIPEYLERVRREPMGHGLMRVITKEGEERIWIYRNITYEEATNAPFVIGHAQDITERVRAEEALRLAHDELETRVAERTAELMEANAILKEQISERRRVEGRLREEEARFRSLFENATIGLYRTTPDGRILLANPTLVRMLGYSSFSEMSKRNLETEGFEPSYRRNHFRDQVEREGQIIGLEASWTRTDGSIISVRESARAIRDSEGRVQYYEGTVEDVTEHKRAEAALRHSEERFAKAFQASPQPMSITTLKQGRYIDVNESFLSMSGYAREEVIGRMVSDLNVWETATTRDEFISMLEREGALRNVEMKFRARSGEMHVLLLSAELIELRGEQCLLLASSDITERKRAEEALRQSEENLRLLVETTNAVPWQADTATWLFTYVGPQAEKLLGYPLAKWYEKDFWTRHIHADDCTHAMEACLKGSDECQNFEFEYRMINAAGESIWIHDIVNCECVDGRAAMLRGFLIDITERKHAEEALRRLADRLTTAQEDEHRRISRSLHDEAGQSLTALSVRLHRLERKFAEQNGKDGSIRTELAELRHIAQSTQENLRHMAHTLHPSVLEHFGLTEAVRAFIREDAADSGAQLLTEISRNFPRFSPTVESTVYRIVQEAVTNALKHAEAERISVTFTTGKHFAGIVIRDDGRGFDARRPEVMAGLGLVSMRERAEMIGAQFTVSSGPGQGTAVELHVPLPD